PAPDRGALAPVEAGTVPAIAAFEAADASLAAGSPVHQPTEPGTVFDGPSGRRGGSLAGDGDGAYAERGQFAVDGCFAVAAVGGDRCACSPGAAADPLDRGGDLWGVRDGAGLDRVVQDDAVVVVDDLGLVAELVDLGVLQVRVRRGANYSG